MAISDEKRREVAQKLRDAATECYNYGVLESDVLNILGVYATDSACLVSSDSVMDVADLIDRPTCELDHIDTDPAQDGYPLRLHECSNCRRLCYEIYGEFEYCPHCGAEVQE